MQLCRRAPRVCYHLPRRASPVKHLQLNFRRLDTAAMRKVCESFRHMHQLERLSLNGNHLGNEGVEVLSRSLPQLPHLRHLDLTDIKVESAGGFILLSALRKHPSEKLFVDLRDNYLGETVQDEIAQWARRPGRQVLLSHNHPLD